MKRWKGVNIKIFLLVALFMAAGILTVLSQKNHMDKLTEVTLGEVSERCIEHTTEFIGDYDGNSAIVQVENYARQISSDGVIGIDIDGDVDELNKGDEFRAVIRYINGKQLYVVSKDAISYDSDVEKNYVFVIVEIPKAWGTEYSLKKEYIEIKESNDEYSAVSHSLRGEYIREAKEEYYEGMLVKIKGDN